MYARCLTASSSEKDFLQIRIISSVIWVVHYLLVNDGLCFNSFFLSAAIISLHFFPVSKHYLYHNSSDSGLPRYFAKFDFIFSIPSFADIYAGANVPNFL
jgi:hypothetical protein